MTQFSRRQFLQLAGITFLGAQLHPEQFWTYPTPTANYGRALIAAPVYHRIQANPTTYLWPDSIVALNATYGNWYRTPLGYIERHTIQPIALYPVMSTPAQPPFWAEVASPAAAVREWCAADAPLVTRIGHGGVAYVSDYLPADSVSGAWYALESDGLLLGWTQAVHWQPVTAVTAPIPGLRLKIDQRTQRLDVFVADRHILQAPLSTGRALTPGDYAVSRGQPSAVTGQIFAAPWHCRIGDEYTLSGVYWHNQFGQPAPGPDVQITTLLARWLYHALDDNAFVTVM